jgi:hypothetical protein
VALYRQNRQHVLIRMDLRNDDLEQIAEQIAAKLIRRFRCRWPRGPELGSLIGG